MFDPILVQGFCILSFCLPRQYHFVNELATWTEAQRYCREKYTDLATTDNMEEMNRLTDTVNARSCYGNGLAWIGLYDDLNTWRWSLDNSDFYKEGERGFRKWYIREPYNRGGVSLCVYISYYGFWYEIRCSVQLPFVCYDGTQNVNESYVVIAELKNWTEAQRYCREHHTDLATIRNVTENQKIQRLSTHHSSYWIGLYRTRTWSDQSNSSFRNWRIGQPDTGQQCTAVSFADLGQWTDEACTYTYSFLCYRKIMSSREYYFVNESKTWAEAQKYCRDNYTDLATVDNMEEMNRLIDAVNGSYNGLAWIGLYDDVNSWRWSLEDIDFYREGEQEFRNWYHVPFNFHGLDLCVYTSIYGWHDLRCANHLRFVCYDGKHNATESYVLVNDYKSWTEAQTFCREHYTDLASVRNESEHQQILNITNGDAVWIGLFRTRLWSDNSESSFRNWKGAVFEEPNGRYQHCVAVSFHDSGKWTDENCLFSFPFVCYSEICNLSSCSPRQYYFVNEPKTWTEAQKYCRDNYTDLATVNDMEAMNRLIEAVNTINCSYNGLAWIGLYDDVNSWRWSLEDSDFYKEGKRDFRNWYFEEPKNTGGMMLCVYMSYYGTWYESSCSSSFWFVCYDGQNVSNHYVLVDQSMSWTEAQSYCRQHYTDLVSVRNDNELQQILSIRGTSTVWIGLYRTRLWSDESNSTFRNWSPGQPDNAGGNQNCTAVSFSDSGKWTDEKCLNTFPFFCYIMESMRSRQYHFVNESKTWAEAQTYCRDNYTDLATIDNLEEMNRLIDAVNGSYNGLAWIGLYDDLNSWRWSLEDSDFYKAEEREFRAWNREPDDLHGREFCVVMGSNGAWFDRRCNWHFHFICFDGRENATESYVLINQYNTWTEAQSYCRDHYTDLASVRNETEQKLIHNTTRGNYVWIGLFRTSMWSDKSNFSFTNWRSSTSEQPDNGGYLPGVIGTEHCTAVSFGDSGQWTDEYCLDRFPFVCYSDHVIGLRVKITTLENLSQSDIEELVSVQLKREFMKLGLPSNFTLTVKHTRKVNP
ncbi:macrophage mannose receptor 1-like [Chanos chanos]|uniref:Macrophage mannose receptor 1-like n=1 Tax=Chanos chanos TaxID=29144 RepID=A0A6J2VHS3_CHACN|nr:macrophage mannose receptor 1-like [Chanos chanos]